MTTLFAFLTALTEFMKLGKLIIERWQRDEDERKIKERAAELRKAIESGDSKAINDSLNGRSTK